MPRWWLRCTVVTAVGVALTVLVVVDPALSVAFDAPMLRAVLETAVTIVGSLVALLLTGRYRRSGRIADLSIAVAMLVLALECPLFVALPALSPGRMEDIGDWCYLVAHACAGALLCVGGAQALIAPPLPGAAAGCGPWREEDARRWGAGDSPERVTTICTVCATALVSFVVLVYFGFDPDASNSSAGAAPAHLFGQPGTSAVRLLSFALFMTAAILFVRRNRPGGDHLIGWLSVGCALLGVGDLGYGLYPPAARGVLHLGDVLRLAAVLVFAVGVVVEIHTYWNESRKLARLEARRAVAADLHDGLAQELALLASHLRRGPRSDATGAWLEQARSASDRALAESRRAIAALLGDQPFALGRDLEGVVREVAAVQGVEVEVDVETSVLDRFDREPLLRIVREALVNAVRHGRPSRVRVELRGEPWPVLRVQDDGCGFDPGGVGCGGGLGIVSMRERARMLGAALRIDAAPGRGTIVELSWDPGAGQTVGAVDDAPGRRVSAVARSRLPRAAAGGGE